MKETVSREESCYYYKSTTKAHFTTNSNYGVPLSFFLMVGFCLGTGFLKIKMGYSVLFFAAGCGHGAWVWPTGWKLPCWVAVSGNCSQEAMGASSLLLLHFVSACILLLVWGPALRSDDKAVNWESLCPWGHSRVGPLDQRQTKLLF